MVEYIEELRPEAEIPTFRLGEIAAAGQHRPAKLRNREAHYARNRPATGGRCSKRCWIEWLASGILKGTLRIVATWEPGTGDGRVR